MKLSNWVQAARPPAQINLALPLLFGQFLAFKQSGIFSWTTALLLASYSLTMHLYIVFWNDWADHAADCYNETPSPFSGGSRVLQQGLLTPRALFVAGTLSAVLVFALGVLFTLYLDRPWTLLLFALGTLLLWAYSLPPLRLNYRGGGEFLQALGVGLVLPVVGCYIQADTPAEFGFILPYCGHQLAVAIAFALPDAAADRAAKKRTFAAVIGPKRAGALVVCCGILAQFSLFLIHPHGFLLSPLNLPTLPLLTSLALLPRIPSRDQSATPCRSSRNHTLAFVALTITTGVFYVLGIFLSD